MTNYEKVIANLTINKMSYLMFKVPEYCPFNYGCNECEYYNDNLISQHSLCLDNQDWTQEDYIEWLNQEVKE